MKPSPPPSEDAKRAEDDASAAAKPHADEKPRADEDTPALPSAVAAGESKPDATAEDPLPEETAPASAAREFTAPLDAAKERQRGQREKEAENAAAKPSAQSTYGSDLKAARERMDVSPADIAASLHLDESVIRAVEAGEANNLPAPVYVRGYIRAYANLVGLNGDGLIKNYDEFNVVPESSTPPVSSGDAKRYPHANLPQRRPGLVLGAIVAVIVIALAFTLWGVWRNFDWSFVTDVAGEPPIPAWRSERQTNAPAAANQPAPATGEAQQPAPVEAQPSPAVELPSPEPAEAQPSPAAEEPAPAEVQPSPPAEAPSPAPAEAQPSAATEAPSPAPAEAQPTPAAEEPSPAPVEAQPAAFEGDAPAFPAFFEDGSPAAELVFTFTEDSWLEVSDRTEVVYYDMGWADESVSVSGQPPFTIKIGNAAGVQVRYQGEVVALPPHTRGGVANLVVH